MKHKHTWKLAYSLKYQGKTEYKYRCEVCEETKVERTAPKTIERASNRGGEFSTNWRP